MTSQKVKLQSLDKVNFEVDIKVAKTSNFIKERLETLGDDLEEVIVIPAINGAILSKVIQWVDHHKDDPDEEGEVEDEKVKRSPDLTSWDFDIMDVDQGTLFDLTNAANYLEVEGLLSICCKSIANRTKGKTTEQIRDMFNIPNDFSPAEEVQIRKDNEWLEEE